MSNVTSVIPHPTNSGTSLKSEIQALVDQFGGPDAKENYVGALCRLANIIPEEFLQMLAVEYRRLRAERDNLKKAA